MARLFAFAATLLSITAASPAFADNLDDCSRGAYAGEGVQACSDIIANATPTLRAVAYVYRGIAFQVRGDLDKAIDDFTFAIQANPSLANGYAHRGLVYANRKDLAHALADYNEAIRLAPDAGEIFYARGLAEMDTGDTAQAISDFKVTIRSLPETNLARANAVSALAALGVDVTSGKATP